MSRHQKGCNSVFSRSYASQFMVLASVRSVDAIADTSGSPRIRAIVWSILLVVLGTFSRMPDAAATDSNTTSAPGKSECLNLTAVDFTHIQDAPTQITETELVEPSPSAPERGSKYCRVRGYVAPQVGFELRLPISDWNGKFIEIGCGGTCGYILTFACPRTYACVEANAGHDGAMSDALWAYGNLQGMIDWAYRAAHVTAVAGKAITDYFYHSPTHKAYFWGCSNGGRQALMEAQRFPWDFDGIIAGAPGLKISGIVLGQAWNLRAMSDGSGHSLLGKTDLKMITDAVVAKCDAGNGAKHHFVENPESCRFDPATLLCRANQTSGCLSVAQVNAVKKMYAGPMTSSGEKLSPGGVTPGSEYYASAGDSDWSGYLMIDGKAPSREQFVSDALKYLLPAPALSTSNQIRDIDFDRDYKRLLTEGSVYDAANPDLSAFKAAGGKLLAYQGASDVDVFPEFVESYYRNVERLMGGRSATQPFFRLFVLPGVAHCGGGAGADVVDYLETLDRWVETGAPPDNLIAAHLRTQTIMDMPSFPLDRSQVEFTRPVFPYPIRTKYAGRGDPQDAASFVAAPPNP